MAESRGGAVGEAVSGGLGPARGAIRGCRGESRSASRRWKVVARTREGRGYVVDLGLAQDGVCRLQVAHVPAAGCDSRITKSGPR